MGAGSVLLLVDGGLAKLFFMIKLIYKTCPCLLHFVDVGLNLDSAVSCAVAGTECTILAETIIFEKSQRCMMSHLVEGLA